MTNIEEIRARVEAATPGPWGIGNDSNIVRGLEVTGRGSYTCVSPVAEIADEDDRYEWGLDGNEQFTLVDPDNDAEFIAHAREDVPALLTVVDAAAAYVDALARSESENPDGWQAEQDALIAAVRALRGEPKPDITQHHGADCGHRVGPVAGCTGSRCS